MAATSPSDAWAAGLFSNGQTDQTLIEHWDGASWSQVASPDPFEDDNLAGVAATSAGSAVAVGSGQTAARGGTNVSLALRWTGGLDSRVQPAGGRHETADFLVGVSGPTPTQTLAFPVR